MMIAVLPASGQDSLSKPKGARQRANYLAGDHRLCGDGSSAGRLVRIAPGGGISGLIRTHFARHGNRNGI
jgi:hypothetical protein